MGGEDKRHHLRSEAPRFSRQQTMPVECKGKREAPVITPEIIPDRGPPLRRKKTTVFP